MLTSVQSPNLPTLAWIWLQISLTGRLEIQVLGTSKKKDFIHRRWPCVKIVVLSGAVRSASSTMSDMKVKNLQQRCEPSPSSLQHQLAGITSFSSKDSGSMYFRNVGKRCRTHITIWIIPATKTLSHDGDHILSFNKIYVFLSKPTRCTISQISFILEQHSTCFGRSLRPSSGV